MLAGAALGLGLLGFIVAAIVQDHVFAAANLQVALPAFGLTLAAALWLAGLGLAAAALVLGWFLIVAVVVAAACAIIVILHAVM